MAPKIWLHTVGGGLLSNIPVIFTRSGLEVLGEVMNSYDKKKRAICKFFFFFSKLYETVDKEQKELEPRPPASIFIFLLKFNFP